MVETYLRPFNLLGGTWPGTANNREWWLHIVGRPHSRQQLAIPDDVDNNNFLVYWDPPATRLCWYDSVHIRGKRCSEFTRLDFSPASLPSVGVTSWPFERRTYMFCCTENSQLNIEHEAFLQNSWTVKTVVTTIVRAYDSSSCYFLCLLDNCSSDWQVTAQSDSKYKTLFSQSWSIPNHFQNAYLQVTTFSNSILHVPCAPRISHRSLWPLRQPDKVYEHSCVLSPSQCVKWANILSFRYCQSSLVDKL